MLMPSIFGEDLFNDDFMNGFKFPDVDKVLYGKHASNVMKTDVRETESGYEVKVLTKMKKRKTANISARSAMPAQ